MIDLVTGGGGFIGRHIVDLLLQQGERVRVLDLDPGDAGPAAVERITGPAAVERITGPAAVERITGSVTDADAVAAAMRGVRRVFHVAGNPSLWAKNRDDFARVNHLGTRTVLAEAARCGVQRFVHTSSGAILFRPPGVKPGAGPEASAASLDDMPGPYCRSKYLAEQEALAAAAQGQPVVVVNPTLPIGPGDHRMTPPSRMIADFLNGRTPAFVEFELNMVDVRDAAMGHLLAAERGLLGERYLLGGHTLRLSQVLALIEDITGVAMPRRRVPYVLALAAAAVAETFADRVTGVSPQATLTGVRLTRRPLAPELARPPAALGLDPRPLRDTLGDAIRWLAESGRLRRPPPKLLALLSDADA